MDGFPPQGFPGLIAPASLKPPRRISARIVQAEFSGVNCPGLIEARGTAVSASPDRSRFPGLIAPASLKLSSWYQTPVRIVAVFRG